MSVEPAQPTNTRKRARVYLLIASVIVVVVITATAIVITRAGRATTAQSSRDIGVGYWHTNGAHIYDTKNQEVRITGINWFGFETNDFALGGLNFRSYRDILRQVKQLGYNTIRLPFSNQFLDNPITPTTIDYSQNPDLQGLQGLALMDKIIAYGGSIGLRFILDQHRPDDGVQSPLWYADDLPESRWIADWQMLARHYLGNTVIIGADLHNEPHSPACWGCGDPKTDWRLAAERGGNAVLAINPNWLIIVEGVGCVGADCYWNGGNLAAAKQYPVQLNVPNRLVYSAHDYPSTVFAQSWFSATDYPNNLPSVWDAHWGYLIKDDIAPVWVGEFGTFLQTTSDQQWLAALTQYLGKGANGISWAYWDLNPESSDTGGILQADWSTVNQNKQNYLTPIEFPLS